MDLLLQALVSLTHNDNAWARKVVESPYGLPFLLRMVYKTSRISRNPSTQNDIKKEEDAEEMDEQVPRTEQSSDTLCLVLGLLTNLVQTTPQSKDILRDIRE